jgi:hypothetical protein
LFEENGGLEMSMDEWDILLVKTEMNMDEWNILLVKTEN